MARIQIKNVTKTYGQYATVLKDFSLEVSDGEFLVLVGPSGCGKSTLLRMVAGLESITSGDILIDGKVVNEVAAKDRDLSMIFQTYALFPYMSVRENLGFGMKLRKVDRAEAENRITKAAETLGLSGFLDRKPMQLSGGQRQRVAIGRALVRNPMAFLMDEPLSNLDTKLRVHMRTEFLRLREQLGTTTMYVTHDQTEAMTLGHRVCVMLDGKIQQIASPEELFARPVNLFVAGFIGTPEMNFAHGKIENNAINVGDISFPIPQNRDLSGLQERELIVGIRPTDFRYNDPDTQNAKIEIKADLVERLGSENHVIFHVESKPVRPRQFAGVHDDVEDLGAKTHTEFMASIPGNVSVVSGDVISTSVDLSNIHLFNPETGVAIAHN